MASEAVSDDVYAKQSIITGLRTATTAGQPNWGTVFESIRNLHAVPEKVGVFFSGPSQMGHQISVSCKEYSKDDFRFVWKKGNF